MTAIVPSNGLTEPGPSHSKARRRSSHPLGHRRGGALKGCLIAAAIALVIAIGVGIWIAMSWKGWAAAGLKQVTTTMVQQSELPADQKDRITARVNGLADDFKAGKLNIEQLGKVFEQIGQSPLMTLGMVEAANKKYVEPSALTAEEKAAGVRSMQRFARGVFEKKIAETTLQDVLTPLQTTGPGGNSKLKDSITADELKQFLDNCKTRADGAQIPDEPFTINYADELDKAIDAALAGGA